LLSVSDQGPGVPDAHKTQIFEPFYRLPGASETSGGVGLGLALVKSIAERHGGTVWCEDAPEGGARFVLKLPLAPLG
jgi:signal transduction histidine kinase